MPVILDSILRAGEGKILRHLKRISEQINSVEDDFAAMSDAELRGMTDEFRQRYADGETLDDLLPEAFAAVREVRRAIAAGDLWELVERRARAHPALQDAVRELRRHNDSLEEYEPLSRTGAMYYVGPETAHRPVLHRYRRRLMERYAPPPAKGVLVLPGYTYEMPDTFRISLTGSDEMFDRALPVFTSAIREPARA